MRLKKGSKVEVLSKRVVPLGSWCPAEILLGNGHNYHVRYEGSSSDTGDMIVERVSRKVIRPCPPAVGGIENWVVGDIVEVFDNNSWKMAEVSEVVGGNYFFVRLLGSSRAFRVHKSDLRLRQSWEDNQWAVIGKDSGNSEDGEANKQTPGWINRKPRYQMPPSDVKMKVHDGGNHLQELNVPSGGMKRRFKICSLHMGTAMGCGQKLRAIEKEGGCRHTVLEQPTPFLEKRDDVASPGSMVGENCIHASFNNRMNGFYEMGTKRRITNTNEKCFKTSDGGSRLCSVGSCGRTSCQPSMPPLHFTIDPRHDSDCLDDAESCC